MNDLPLIERLRDALAKVLPHYVSSAGWSDSDTRMFNSTLAEATARLAASESAPPAEAAHPAGWWRVEVWKRVIHDAIGFDFATDTLQPVNASDLLRIAEAIARLAAGEGDLWCMHIHGPDDVHAAPSKTDAERAAAWFNRRWGATAKATGVMCKAVVAPWPHSPESHAESVKDWAEQWTIPAPPAEAANPKGSDAFLGEMIGARAVLSGVVVPPAEAAQVGELEKLVAHLYATGYTRGHHDTVEACYTDVLPVDLDTYFADDDSVRETIAAIAALRQPSDAAGIARAAAYVQKKADDYAEENTSQEWDTGAAVYHYGQAGEDYHHGLLELAEEIAALAHAGGTCDVPPAGWSCSRTKGHEGPCAAWPATPQYPAPSADVGQRARELLAHEHERDGYPQYAALIRSGKESGEGCSLGGTDKAALRAIESALAQLQQLCEGCPPADYGDGMRCAPCPRRSEKYHEGDNSEKPPVGQQASGQAVAWRYVRPPEEGCLEVHGQWCSVDHPASERIRASYMRAGCRIEYAYLAAPALPDVSDAQVEAASIAYDLVGPQPDWRSKSMRAALESYRASLLGEVKP